MCLLQAESTAVRLNSIIPKLPSLSIKPIECKDERPFTPGLTRNLSSLLYLPESPLLTPVLYCDELSHGTSLSWSVKCDHCGRTSFLDVDFGRDPPGGMFFCGLACVDKSLCYSPLSHYHAEQDVLGLSLFIGATLRNIFPGSQEDQVHRVDAPPHRFLTILKKV